MPLFSFGKSKTTVVVNDNVEFILYSMGVNQSEYVRCKSSEYVRRLKFSHTDVQ